jgi:DnaK suppressor protein
LERLRQALIQDLTALYRSAHADVRESMIEEAFDLKDARDEVDDASDTQLRDLRMNLAEADAHRAQLIEATLLRIAAGTYGQCVDCGSSIESRRLGLLPWTPRCLDCQESFESSSTPHFPTL